MWVIALWLITGNPNLAPEYVKLDNVYIYETCVAYGDAWLAKQVDPPGGYSCFVSNLPQSFPGARHDPVPSDAPKR